MFKVSARTIHELGSELISSDVIAFYELIKNGFDAGSASGVEIHFSIILRRNAYLTLRQRINRGEEDYLELRADASKALMADADKALLDQAREILDNAKSLDALLETLRNVYLLNTITVSDVGTGMSLKDLNSNFLVLGTASRKRLVEDALHKGEAKPPFLGEKGIGRLSAMRLGNRLRVETARASDCELNLLEIDWSAFADLDVMLDEIAVEPVMGGTKPRPDWSGTSLIVGDLAEDWTESRLAEMIDDDFSRLTDPFLDQKQRPRVVLFWNGKRLTIPWMERKLLAHAHARVTGSYDMVEGSPQLRLKLEALNLGFDHPREVDNATLALADLEGAVLGTEHAIHDSALRNVGPFKFEAHWFNRRLLSRIDGVGELKAVRELQRKWSGILLFRDGFRVFPYGEDDDDWLGLDRKALGRKGYLLNKTQFIGRVTISRTVNPDLVDQTNREGLRETPEQQVLLRIMDLVINDQLADFLKRVEKDYKIQKIDLSDAKSEISKLEERAKTALRQIEKVTPKESQEVVEDLRQTIFEFREFAEKARQRVAEVEQETRQMVELAGVGLMVEVVAHELARASENALENLESLRKRGVPDEVKTPLESLRAQMKSLSKRVRILDPLSIAGRQRTEIFDLDDLVRETLAAHEAQFARHNIHVKLDLPNRPVKLRAVKGMVVQILENLISNSKYWIQIRQEREAGLCPTITIALNDSPPSIIFEDNGRGVNPENREKVFKPFFSLKEKRKRRGIGLFIARECAHYNGGTLVLDDKRDNETGRLQRFILEFPPGTSVS